MFGSGMYWGMREMSACPIDVDVRSLPIIVSCGFKPLNDDRISAKRIPAAEMISNRVMHIHRIYLHFI